MTTNSKTIALPDSIAEKADDQKSFNVWIAIGLAVVAVGGYFVFKYKNRHPDQSKISDIRRQLSRSFPIAEPNLCPLTQERTKIIEDEHLSMDIHYISQLQNKTKTTLSSTRNPFLPPFQKGLMITELPPKHRLLYNKFYFYKNHVLVVTQEYEDQGNRIEVEDFKQCMLVCIAINGVFFYNSGQQSGFSQKHKHIQILPQQAHKLPILKLIEKHIGQKKLQLLPYKSKQNISIHLFTGYNFIHGIVLLPEEISTLPLEEVAIKVKESEEVLYRHFVLILKKDKFSYNIIGTTKFIMMIPRKSEKTVGEIGVNAICFMGSMLVKDPKLFQNIEKLCKPSGILRDLTYTQIN